MPIYEYNCPQCDKTFEKLYLSAPQRADEQICPGCGYSKTHRILSTISTVKGANAASSSTCGTGSSGFS